MIKLGQEVKDKVTGFTGIAVVRAEHLFGCIRIGVKPQGFDKDGKIQEQEFFDEAALIVLSDGIMEVPENPEISPDPKSTGGPDRERPHRERY